MGVGLEGLNEEVLVAKGTNTGGKRWDKANKGVITQHGHH
jgi:hypothetical protein